MFGHENVTNTSELQKIGMKLFGSKFLGVFSQDCLPLSSMKNGRYAIINVDKKRDLRGNLNRGSHWVAISSYGDSKLMVYDSFGRPTKKLLQNLYKKMKKSNIGYKDTEYDQEQWLVAHCGQLAVSWLVYFDKYGPEKAKWI